ncbi:MAG: hypothetical protein RBR67_20600 [Desulfobacterium sp.]|nr:hypothetical protein [Desulfobacterium sp.]
MLKWTSIKSKLKIVVFALVFTTVYAVTAWAGLTKTEVSQLYVSIFGRASEGSGNAYWQTNQPDMITTANVMLATTAARGYFGSSLDSNQAFIEHIFKNTLNKTLADDKEGIAYWVGEINKGKSRGEVVVSLVNAINDYAPNGPFYDPGNAKTIAAYNQFTNRLEVSNYMADTVQEAPGDWAVSTSFTGKLFVTDDPATKRAAQQILGAMAGGGNALADDIRYYMAMISSVGDLSPMVSEIGTLFGQIMEGDSKVVTITPPLDKLDINNLPPSIKINADFGAGYRPEGSTSVYTGKAVVNITNIAFSDTGIKANAALTATNLKRDGELILNGAMGLNLNVGMVGSDTSVAADISFTNLQSLDSQINGTASLSMKLNEEGDITQPIILTLNQLASPDFQVSGTVTMSPVGMDTYDVLFNLDTDKGKVEGTVRMAGITGDGDEVVLTTPFGPLSAGGINLNINSVTMNSELCPETPSGGSILFTRGAETSTMTFSNCTYTLE